MIIQQVSPQDGNMEKFEIYQSPYSWRYASESMRKIWSEREKRRLWRHIWVVLAEVQAEFGLAEKNQVEELRSCAGDVNLKRSLEIEAEIHHDLMAELKAFAEQCPEGGGILHRGATSMDIEDNADALRLRAALDLILDGLGELLKLFAAQIEKWADKPVMAFTHLQPAEPTTLGYRLAQYAQDLLEDYETLKDTRQSIRGKGFTGAVGTAASYGELIGMENLADFESRLSLVLDLQFYPVTTQVYPRKQDYHVVSALAGLGASLYKLAFDLRILQSPPIGEISEPFGTKQVGSSAMPFKRNPIRSEKMDSLARTLAQLPRIAWDNAAHSLLERTLDDSANRRSLLPEAFLIVDELLITARVIVKGVQVDESAVERNMQVYGPFAATERVLMAVSKSGADRQLMHEKLRGHALSAWEAMSRREANPLADLVAGDPDFNQLVPEAELRRLMDASMYVGEAPKRARAFSKRIKDSLKSS
jgi:adenylosuccinate lyase